MSQTDKDFKVAFFHKVELSRVFVSGPINPLEHPLISLPDLPKECLHELELELRKFFDEDLMEIRDKHHFYVDVKASRENVTPNSSRNYPQACLIGDYLRPGGNVALLRSIWTNVETITNYQSRFADFDWSEEGMTVKI